MQIRCTHCHRPFALARQTVFDAIDALRAEGLIHYNAFCPHCRRANRVSLEEMLRAAPDWTRTSSAVSVPIKPEAAMPAVPDARVILPPKSTDIAGRQEQVKPLPAPEPEPVGKTKLNVRRRGGSHLKPALAVQMPSKPAITEPVKTEPKPSAVPKPKAEPKPKAVPRKVAAKAVTAARVKAPVKPKTAPKARSKAKAKSPAKAKVKPASVPKTKVQTKPTVKRAPIPKPKQKAKTKAK